jgi:hypothetical protein
MSAALVGAGCCFPVGVTPGPTPVVIYVTPAPTATRSPVPSFETHTVKVTLSLNGALKNYFVLDDGSCTGSSTQGHGDISASTNATLKNESGTILASARLGKGRVADSGYCVFAFDFTNVGDAKFYTITVGRRGELSYSKDDLIKKDWSIDLFV